MRTLEHPTLGTVEVVVEVMHKEKHFYLIKKKTKKVIKKSNFKYGTWWIRENVEVPAEDYEKGTYNHYCMWGNTNDPNQMGTTKILTDKGNRPRINTINKKFLEIVNASENLTFKK